MSLRKILGISVAIQIVGSLATLLATIFITRTYGPKGQGYLTYFRSTVDLAVSIGIFGLPQAFVYMINTGQLKVSWALKFSGYYSILFTIIFTCSGTILYMLGIAQLNGFDGFAVGCAVLASTGLLAHNLYRAIVLVTSSTRTFNLITILPALFLLVYYLIFRQAKYEVLTSAHVVAALLSVIAVMTLFAKDEWSSTSIQRNDTILKSAFHYSFWSFVPHICLALASFGTYTLLRQGANSDAAVGQFSVAVLLLSIAVLPLNMIIPILFNAWSDRDSENLRRSSFMKLAHLGTFLSIIGFLLGLIFLGPITMLIFGQDLMPSVTATKVMLVGIFALYQNRLSSALLLSLGKPVSVAVGAMIRVIVIMILLLQGFSESIAETAIAWIVGEFASVAYLLFITIKLTGWPMLKTFGLSPSWVRENLPTFHTLRI
jgi:O-antigen/teichoic acid export membrane protein